ncbi:MAG: alpha/beta hydrolase [Capsulimonadales bacterium]|nr:alpha/beta hydrolase [Capsulimonadales bacterium]
MKTTTSDGIGIDYVALGPADSTAPTLVLTTAWCMSRNGWADLPETLAAKGYRVLSLTFRGHGDSQRDVPDHGAEGLYEDVVAVLRAENVDRFIPVTMSHSGWIGILLRRHYGPEKVPAIVHTDWIVVPPPPEYMGLVDGLADPNAWEGARDILFNIWLEDSDNEAVNRFVKEEMGGYGADIWNRSGRVIGSCLRDNGSALEALSKLNPLAPTLHVYAQPKDPGYKAAQEQFGQANPWYEIAFLPEAKSHFPAFEVADEMATAIDTFVKRTGGAA